MSSDKMDLEAYLSVIRQTRGAGEHDEECDGDVDLNEYFASKEAASRVREVIVPVDDDPMQPHEMHESNPSDGWDSASALELK